MNERPGIFIAEHKNIQRGSVELYEQKGIDKDSKVSPTKEELVFVADGSTAGDLFLWGIAKSLLDSGKQGLLVKNPDDEIDVE